MTPASEFAERLGRVKEQESLTKATIYGIMAKRPGFHSENFHVGVGDDGGLCFAVFMDKSDLTPADALRFADWIKATFGEGK